MSPGDAPGGPTGPGRAARGPAPDEPPSAVARFLIRGTIQVLPRRRADRDLLLRYVATRTLAVHHPLSERELTTRLAGLATDPIGIRRELVDAGLVTRTRDGAEYWRTHVTEFDTF
ncbi:DUF2087 domain-containing protein [uncultured Cellulomonas sp.]|uniref:DUF2087 domain-containing protein n=1 Tax=uncultured Cellulomonas sp. TaxID=189682 RepID=UPI0026243DDE|nr:DUF2087 domain-containing protein [uncultured Cellulomonas sp.]